MYMPTNKKSLYRIMQKVFVLTIVSIIIVAPLTISEWPIIPNRAYAGGKPVIDVANIAVGKITAGAAAISANANTAIVTKEYVLDGIVWPLANRALEGMLQSTINWINSGFQGKPMYITDLNAFLRDVADSVAQDYLLENLDFLCSPYKLDIQVALALNYARNNRNYEVQCRISDAVDNLEGYLSGDFIGGGGWNSWYEVTLNPSNNIYGSIIDAQTNMNIVLANKKDAKILGLNWGEGFLGLDKCDANGKNCKTVTPGTAIKSSLDNALNIPADRLTVADEIDEVLSALFTQLVSRTLNVGGGGLRGLGQSSGTRGSYFDNLNATPQPKVTYPNQQTIGAAEVQQSSDVLFSGNNNTPIGSQSSIRDEYIGVLNVAADTINVCKGTTVSTTTRNRLDTEMNAIVSTIELLLKGDLQATQQDIDTYRTQKLPAIENIVYTSCITL